MVLLSGSTYEHCSISNFRLFNNSLNNYPHNKDNFDGDTGDDDNDDDNGDDNPYCQLVFTTFILLVFDLNGPIFIAGAVAACL